MTEFNQQCPYIYNLEDPKKYIDFGFEPDHFQKWGMRAINMNHNLFCSAHTGSGKTVLAIHAIAKTISENNQVLYTSPIKSLSNQKYKELSDIFDKDRKNGNVGILTGDKKDNPTANILIMTAEILRNSLLRKSDESVYEWNFNPEKVGCVILDEVHFINNKSRGKVWEDIIINLKPNIQLVMLSATLNGADKLVKWIGELKQVPCHFTKTKKRPVPLKHLIFHNNKLELIMNDEEWNNNKWDEIRKLSDFNFKKNRTKSNIPILFKCIKKLKDENNLPVNIFLLNRDMVEKIANKIPYTFISDEDDINLGKIKKIWSKHLSKYEEIYKYSSQWLFLKKLVERGIGIHHSGLITILKEIVEILYEEKLLKVLIATETFAMGVNMPTRTVIFTQLTKFDGNGRRLLRSDEYTQMGGRAGRRGKDKFGNVIIIPEYDMILESEAKIMLKSPPQKVESKFEIDYSFILKKIIFKIDNKIDDQNFMLNSISKSLIHQEIFKNIKSLEKEKSEINIVIDQEITEFKDMYFRLQDINDSLSGLKKITNRERKKLQKELNIINKKIPKSIIPKLKKFKMKSDKLLKLERIINYEKEVFNSQIEKIYNFLKFNKFLDDDYNLTKLGRIVGEVNECNPIILGEIIIKNYLDDLSFSEICSFLSMFLNDRSLENVYFDDLLVSDELKEKMYNISDYCQKMLNEENKLNQTLPLNIWSDWNLHLGTFNAVKLWADGKKWNDVKIYYKTFEGNFNRNILRLTNLLRNIIVIAKLIDNFELINKLIGFEEKLIRDNVTTDSLYI